MMKSITLELHRRTNKRSSEPKAPRKPKVVHKIKATVEKRLAKRLSFGSDEEREPEGDSVHDPTVTPGQLDCELDEYMSADLRSLP